MRSPRNLRLHELGQQGQRLLPAEIAGLGRDDGGDALLHDLDLGADRDLAQDDRGLHLRSLGTSSTKVLAKEWLLPDEKLVNDMR